MLKKSLFIGTFFLLFMGLSDYGYGCHRDADGDGKQDPHGNKPCKDDGGGGGDDAEYSVTITGAVSGGSSDGVSWTESSGRKAIQGDFLSDVSGVFGHLDLSFFTVPYPNGPFDLYRGLNCFGDEPVSLYPQAAIHRGRGGRAEGVFWFWAWTSNDDPIPVLYLLKVFGLFDKSTSTGWPPLVTTSAEMTDWVISASNDGGELKNISCIGEGKFDIGNPMLIDVTRTNP